MMKINYKGVTLIELIFSMVLLSIIMLFLLVFINNIMFREENSKFDDDVNAALIIENLNEDLINNGLGYKNEISEIYSIEKDDNNFKISFTTMNNVVTLNINKEDDIFKINYIDNNDKEFTWPLEKGMYIDFDDIDIFYKSLDDQFENIYLKLWIPLYSENGESNIKGNNDFKDDIIVEYYGKVIKLETIN